MWVEAVVFLLEPFGLQVHFLDVPEQMCIQDVFTVGPIEPFDITVLARLAQLYVFYLDVLHFAIVDKYP